MAFEGNPGTNQLANVLATRMKDENNSPFSLDFGEIGADGSLTTNTFPVSIPKGAYSVLRQLTLGAVGAWLTDTSEADGHRHMVPIPGLMRSIGPGDRVLVAWVNNEAVVIDIVKKT